MLTGVGKSGCLVTKLNVGGQNTAENEDEKDWGQKEGQDASSCSIVRRN